MKWIVHGKLFGESYLSKVHDDPHCLRDVTKLLSFANKTRNANRTIIKRNFT